MLSGTYAYHKLQVLADDLSLYERKKISLMSVAMLGRLDVGGLVNDITQNSIILTYIIPPSMHI